MNASVNEKSYAFALFIYRAGWLGVPFLYCLYLGAFRLVSGTAFLAFHWESRLGHISDFAWAGLMTGIMIFPTRAQAKRFLSGQTAAAARQRAAEKEILDQAAEIERQARGDQSGGPASAAPSL
jgi:hypothetical protein